MASCFSFLCQFLSWFEGLAAFQAIQFAARRDQPAKWANTLWREILVARLQPCQLFCQSRQEPKPIADTGKELMKRRRHGFNSQALLSPGDVLGFVLKHQRKNRSSHSSQRNGRMKITARIPLSRNPLRLDGWIRTLSQFGQQIILILLVWRVNSWRIVRCQGGR
jgi:hypothetical protein